MDINSSINITTGALVEQLDMLNRELEKTGNLAGNVTGAFRQLNQELDTKSIESAAGKMTEMAGKIEAGFTAAKSAADAVAADPAIAAAFDKLKNTAPAENAEVTKVEEQARAALEALRNQHTVKQELIAAQASETAALQKTIAENELAAQQETADRRVEIERASFEAKASLALQSVDLLSSVNELLSQKGKEQNDLQKTLALVKIGIDTAVAISSALRNSSGPTPDNVATGGLAGIAKFITLSAQIVGAAAKAKAILGAGQGGGGFNAPSVPTINAPQIQPPNINGGTLINPPVRPQEPIKVYVTEADIRHAQNRVKVIEGQSVVV